MPNVQANDGFLGRAMVIGTIAGTKIRLHWTFLVFLAWIGIGFVLQSGAAAALSGVGFMLALFVCVVAHEFGHILTARYFGIRTPDVTLLPIGGVARLDSIPEQPGRELAVALAGPAVNLVIAGVLIFALGIQPIGQSHAMNLKPENILPNLATTNLFLAAFNLLPAFPMDGGRALRAIIAAFADREKATRIAATIGQLLAIGLGLLGLLSGNPLLIFIAMFVYFGAGAEAQAAQLERIADRLQVADAMMTELVPLSPASPLDEAVGLLLRTSQREFPVLDANGALVGLLTRDRLVQGLHSDGATSPVGEVMETVIPTIRLDRPLREAMALMQRHPRTGVAVLGRDGEFEGLLTQENLGELLLVGAPPSPRTLHIPVEARVPRVTGGDPAGARQRRSRHSQ